MTQLSKLYKLLKNMEAPLAKLVKMFKNNVERIGKGLIREAKTPKDFVDIICKHYDDYRLDICCKFRNKLYLVFEHNLTTKSSFYNLVYRNFTILNM